MRKSHSCVLGILVLIALLSGGCSRGIEVELTLPAEQAPSAGVVAVPAELAEEVTPADLAALYDTDAITIVDVREDSEFAEGHIPGAVHIPLGSLPERVNEIPADEPVVLVCRSGNRSGEAYRQLTQLGFTNVSNMVGGMNAWQAEGLEIAR